MTTKKISEKNKKNSQITPPPVIHQNKKIFDENLEKDENSELSDIDTFEAVEKTR